MRITKTPGVTFGIVHENEIIYSRSLGLADISRNVPCSSNIPFGISSLTKAFTATACALLALDGALDWGEVRSYHFYKQNLIPWLR